MDTASKSVQKLQAKVDSYHWHHSIDFGNGVASKGNGSLPYITAQGESLFSGLTLSGRSLLDIGAWNGAFSFEAKKRGASRVVASDDYCWNNHVFKGRETFDLGLSMNGLDIEALNIDVPEIVPEMVGTFDVVLFSGVFYHLLEAVHLTKRIASCATHILILETHQDFLESDKPGMVFYPGQTLYGDGSNWWGPNPHAMYEMLKEFGFEHVFYQDSPHYDDPSQPSFRKRGIYHAFRTTESLSLMGGVNVKWKNLEDAETRTEIFRALGPNALTLLDEQAGTQKQLATLDEQLHTMQMSNAALTEQLKVERVRSSYEAGRAAQQRLQADAERGSKEALLQSTSWKITAPLRAIAGIFKRG